MHMSGNSDSLLLLDSACDHGFTVAHVATHQTTDSDGNLSVSCVLPHHTCCCRWPGVHLGQESAGEAGEGGGGTHL